MTSRAQLLGAVVGPLPHLTWPLTLKPNESLAGFTGRLCAYNALRNPLVVIRDAGLLLTRGYGYLPRVAGSLSPLATLLAVDDEIVEQLRHSSVTSRHNGSGVLIDFHGATLRRAHMNYAVREVAPSAIRKDPYHREMWHVHTLGACPATGEMLVGKCPEPRCGKPLDWNEVRGIGLCSDVECHGSVEALVAERVPDQQLSALKMAAALIDPDSEAQSAALRRLPECLVPEDRGDLFELAWLLGCLDHPNGLALALDPASGDPLGKCETVARGAQRLTAWPGSLRDVLRDAVQADETGSAVQLAIEVVRAIVRRSKTFGRAAVLIGNELEGIQTNGFSTVVARQLDLLTATEFAQIAGLKNSHMATVQRSKHLARLLFSEGGRDIALFRPSDADDVRQRLKIRLSAQRFASDTGLGIDAVELLVRGHAGGDA